MKPPPPTTCTLRRLGRQLLRELSVDRQLDFVAHQNAAGFERRVPVQAVVAAVELSGCREGDLLVAPGVDAGPLFGDGERDRLRDPLDREIAGDPPALAGPFRRRADE